MKKEQKRGYTLVELMVVLAVLAIVSAIAIPGLGGYIRNAQFRRNNGYAKTLYYAAEASLTDLRTSGQWEDMATAIQSQGLVNTQLQDGARIYALRMNAGEYSGSPSPEARLLLQILEKTTYDPALLEAALALEIDIATGKVYSAFYGSHCAGLAYEASQGILNMNERSYDQRRPERLGYYSAGEVSADIGLEMTRLKITSIHLLNGEALTLNWSTNSRHNNKDIRFLINIYSNAGGQELLSMELNASETDLETGTVTLPVQGAGNYDFPMTYTGGRFSLTLDAMMTAELLEELKASGASARTSSTSVTRFGGALETPLDIYATVQAFPTYLNVGDDTREYQQSTPTKSNVSNSMFADTSTTGEYHITTFRHLSNIRYVDGPKEFVVTKQVLDWQRAKAPLYTGGLTALSSEGQPFPAVDRLRDQQVLRGGTADTTLRSLLLNEGSVPADAQLLGLFCENLGTIRSLRLDALTLRYTGSALRGVGGFCGRSAGSLQELSVTGAGSLAEVYFEDLADAAGAQGAYGAGLLVGILDRGTGQSLNAAGQVRVRLPNAVFEGKQPGGAGGIIGCADLTGEAKVTDCQNSAQVTGNMAVGGVLGWGWSEDAPRHTGSQRDLEDCVNLGLVLYTDTLTKRQPQGQEGHYVGGIAGYTDKIYISGCTSRSGRASGFAYTLADKALLQGTYVGGILGFGKNSLLYNCATEAGGYVLGRDYVGGIVGGLDGGDYEEVLQSASVTRNASYVIGYTYVGGICGRNVGNSTIHDCVNNGVAVGYEAYVGGICGSNEGANAEVLNCASYISDTRGEIYRMILDWEATADYSGGLVGYNSGRVIFDQDTAKDKINHAVSSIVVGKNYVGGVVGFNDIEATIQADYALISGRINASGDCVGGLAGLNASTQLLDPAEPLVMKPNEVWGRNYVGGAIGANLIHMDGDLTVSKLQVDSSLGAVTGEAFCGGLIGYSGTYTALGSGANMAEALTAAPTDYLPVLISGSNVLDLPEAQSTYTMTITGRNVPGGMLNNMAVRAYAYFGGILGYAHGDSRVVLVNCANGGDLTLSQQPLSENSTLSSGVDLELYLTRQGYGIPSLDGLTARLAGGIVGVNGRAHVIDNCRNTGSINGLSAMGGIVGLNQGYVQNCTLDSSMGSSAQDHIGGIVGLNVGSGVADTYDQTPYTQGTVYNCNTAANRAVVGRSNVGGIVGYNLTGGVVKSCANRASISAWEAAGGLCGRNLGQVFLAGSSVTGNRTVYASAQGAGGVIGINGGTLELQGAGDVVAADAGLTVRSREYAGGVVGINQGTIRGLESGANTYYLISRAKLVHTTQGYSGGIVGIQQASATLSGARNESTLVSADSGAAGGIVSVNSQGNTVAGCVNAGDVISNRGYAGGIASENHGTMEDCSVERGVITSQGVEYTGAVCGRNTGTISGITLGTGNVTLEGSATVLGAVTGLNEGTVRDCTFSGQPAYGVNGDGLTIGGAVGENKKGATVQNVTVRAAAFEGFGSYRYLGGVVGRNLGTVQDSRFQDSTIEEGGSAVGNCYGGIVGLNEGTLSGCSVSGLTLTAKGVYTATSTSTTDQKERMSTHIGGIAGKNDLGASITGCTIDSARASTITVDNGMVGGITGFNKGSITQSGDSATVTTITGVSGIGGLLSALDRDGHEPDTQFVRWANPQDVEKLVYDGTGVRVSNGRSMQIIVSVNGNLGGIAGYNAPTGQLSCCATGNWLLNNKSESLGVGSGGIIGMNESEKDLSCLVNRAFVGRQLKNGTSDRFAGGIIGNQNNTTSSGWTIRQCVNYGIVYCYKSHYSGGIIGQWTGTGGTVMECHNYAALHTTHQAGWVGAAGGIVAQLYHPNSGEDFNIISCQNHGSIYGQSKNDTSWCANDSAGILGNITAYTSSTGQRLNINVIDCVNGPGVTITSASMASGIVGFVSTVGGSSIDSSTQNIVLNIDRCRNYAKTFTSGGSSFKGGIFGDRYGSNAGANTYITNCFSVYADNNFPVVSLNMGSSTSLVAGNVGNNYYFGDDSMSQSGTVRSAPVTRLTQYIGTDGGATEYAAAGTRMIHLVKSSDGGYLFVQKGLDSSHAGNNASGGASKSVTRYNGFTQNSTYIGSDGLTLYSRGTKNNTWSPVFSGRVIFTLPGGYNPNSYTLNAIKTAGSDFDTYVRTAYEKLEQTADGQMSTPDWVVTTERNGSYTIAVTDDCRPLYYEVELTVNGVTTTGYLFPKGMPTGNQYESSGTFNLGANGAAVRLRSVGMFAAPSDWVDGNYTAGKAPMPAPELQGKLVKNGNTYEYRFTMANEEDYAEIAGWTVEATTLNGQSMILSAGVSGILQGAGNIQELTLQAIAPAGSGYTNSEPVSVAISIPGNGLPAAISKPIAMTHQLSGDALEELEITVLLSWDGGKLDTPPIYRVELLGTVEGQEMVLAYGDVLAAAGSSVSTIFRDLPEVITQATDLKLRAWYADTGLGSILTYETVDTPAAAGGVTIRQEKTLADGTTQVSYIYLHSTVLENRDHFDDYILEQDLDIQFLEPPVLMDPGAGAYLQPEWSEGRKELRYTFSWDAQLPATENARYGVNLMGISGDKEVLILTDSVYDDPAGREFTINADDWQYSAVRLTVTRLGDGDSGQIGRSSSRVYLVSSRLEAPGQPFVSNNDPNEMNYTVTWTYPAAASCGGYTLYVSRNGTVVMQQEISGGSTDTFSPLKLDDFAGETVDIYLRAKAAAAGFEDSPDGTAYTLTLPRRLPTPSGVTWDPRWTYDAATPMAAADFYSGGMRLEVDVTDPGDPGNKYELPGGSAFLLKAEILDTDGRTVLDTYTETAMVTDNDTIHYHQLQGLSIRYAGRYIRFSLRATYGNGMVSSQWAESPVFRLPYVRLAAPGAVSGETVRNMTVFLGNSPDLKGQEEREWTATLRTLAWNTVEGADVYPVTITYRDGSVLSLRIYQDGGSILVEKQDPDDGSWQLLNDLGSRVHLGTTGDLQGLYTTNSTLPYFTYTMDTELSWMPDGRGGYTFTLLLPNIATVETDQQELLDAANVQAVLITVCAEVRENLEGAGSDSYVGSGEEPHNYA